MVSVWQEDFKLLTVSQTKNRNQNVWVALPNSFHCNGTDGTDIYTFTFKGLKKGFFFYISLTPVKIILLSFFHISKFAVSTLCMSRLSFNHCFSDFHIHQTKCVRLVHDILSWERAGQPYQSSHQNNVFLGFLDF